MVKEVFLLKGRTSGESSGNKLDMDIFSLRRRIVFLSLWDFLGNLSKERHQASFNVQDVKLRKELHREWGCGIHQYSEEGTGRRWSLLFSVCYMPFWLGLIIPMFQGFCQEECRTLLQVQFVPGIFFSPLSGSIWWTHIKVSLRQGWALHLCF